MQKTDWMAKRENGQRTNNVTILKNKIFKNENNLEKLFEELARIR